MTGDPDEVIDRAEQRKETIREHYLPAAEWFLKDRGLGPRTEVVADLAAHLDVDREVANHVVGHLVEDDADPVQQVLDPIDGKFVGVIDHAEHEWFYAFDRYDDVDGRQRRAVCAHCVHAETSAADVTHFTRPPEEYDIERARTALALHYHVDHEGRGLTDVVAEDVGVDPDAFAQRHDLDGADALSLRDVTRRLGDDPGLQAGRAPDRLAVPDVDVEPGASLVSETTIAGNAAWHAGNDGPGSTLDADTLDGKQLSEITTQTTTLTTRAANVLLGDTVTLQFSTLPVVASAARFSVTGGVNVERFRVENNGTYTSNPTAVNTTLTTGQYLQAEASATTTTTMTFEANLYY